LGIDGGTVGVSANQNQFADSGLPNFPVLDSAVASSTGVTVTGRLRSQPGRTFTLDFYSSPACDASGSGEGGAFLASTTVTLPNASGSDVTSERSFTVALPTVALGSVVTATTTDHFPFTSEFSACETVTAS
jgi:hypothetical protein